MTNDHDDMNNADGGDAIHGLAGVYALDALDDAERLAFDAHLADCETCRLDVAEFREAALALGEVAAEPPPSAMKASVMAAVAATSQEPVPTTTLPEPSGAAIPIDRASAKSARRRRWMAPVGIAAALILAVSAAVVVVNLPSDEVSIADVYAADDIVISSLAGDGVDGDVTVAWSRTLGRVAVEADDVAEVRSGGYELWAVVGGVPVASGWFEHSGGDVSEVFEIDESDVAAWGITIEPEDGADEPTTPILFFGEV